MLTALPPRQRALVALRCHEELTEGEAAEVLGCSEATARELTEEAMSGLDEDRVRRTLDEPVVVDESLLLAAVGRGAQVRRRRRRSLTVVAVAAVVGAVAIAAALSTGWASKPEAPRGLEPAAVALAATDSERLWAVTHTQGCTTCSTLWVGDGTATGWTERYRFDRPAVAAQLRMAPNGMDGWAWFGRHFLQATHDGGRTWVVPGLDLRNAEVEVEVAGANVWVLLHQPDGPHVWQSPIGSDDWVELPAPREDASRYALAPLRGEMWVVQYFDRRTVMSPARAPDRTYPVPCTSDPVPPRPSGGALWVTCPDEGRGLTVKRTRDGRSWVEIARSQGTAAGSVPISDEATFVVTGSGGRRVTAQGLTDVPLQRLDGESVESGTFVSDEIGFLLTDQGRVLRSDNGGRSWTEVG